MESSCRLQSELRPAFWGSLHLAVFVITSYSIHYTKLYDNVRGDLYLVANIVMPNVDGLDPELVDTMKAKLPKE